MKKKIMSLLIGVVTVIFLTGCKLKNVIDEEDSLHVDKQGNKQSEEDEKKGKKEIEIENQDKNQDEDKHDKRSHIEADTEKNKLLDDNGGKIMPIRDITSIDLIKEINIGWNLGNTLDATGNAGKLTSETSWGNPITTKEMFDLIKKSGFNTIRIPVTWESHLGEAPEYLIDDKWIARVKEVVDYSIDNDLFTIINIHHEEWHFPSYENVDQAKDQLVRVWEQIAEYFMGYDEHLIFEGMNEPRMKGTSVEWNGNEEGYDVINQLNEVFIHTIRNSGGNNKLRHLMIPTYAASSDITAFKTFKIPEDNKVIISIHAYTPYNFALNDKGTSSWQLDNENDIGEIDRLMNRLDEYFISKGAPVILGEFGARDKNDNINERVSWAKYYIKAAKEVGIPCIWWDNGSFSGSGENFGILSRRDVSLKHPEIVEALMSGLE